MKKDIKRILIETTVKTALKNGHDSPRRTVRNLVDLWACLANGRFQKRFLHSAQEMLQNENSAYYDLIDDLLHNTDRDTLLNFGVNLGYSSCTLGAEKIRETESKQSFNIPWALSAALDEEKLADSPSVYRKLVEQGVSLGIYTYLLFAPEKNAEYLVPIPEANRNCAFLLFFKGNSLNQDLIEALKPLKNIMIAISADSDTESAANLLRENRMLYSVYQSYGESDVPDILSGKALRKILGCRPCFYFLLPNSGVSEELRRDVCSYISETRSSQSYPVVLTDIYSDLEAIDEIVSDDKCTAGFSESGNLFTNGGILRNEDYNIFNSSLQNILQKAMRKSKI